MASRFVVCSVASVLVFAALGLSGCSESTQGLATADTNAEAAPAAKAVVRVSDAPATDGKEGSEELLPPLLPDPNGQKGDESSEPFASLKLPPLNEGASEERPAFDPADAAQRAPWMTDYKQALAKAKAEKKDVLLDFTGSDWCRYCIVLNREVFSRAEFIKYAPQKFILVEVDFPRGESDLSPATRKQNDQLQDKFGVDGFPTIVLADSEGRAYAKTGYEPGGAVAYIKHLEALRKTRSTRDEAFAKADGATGTERAKLLAEALTTLPPNLIFVSYRPVVEEIIKLDANDEAGMKSKWEDRLSSYLFSTRWQQLGRTLGQSQDPDEILAGVAEAEKEFSHYPPGLRKLNILKLSVYRAFNRAPALNKGVTEALANKEYTDEERFQLYMLKMTPLAQNQKFAEAEKVIAEAIADLGKSKDKEVIVNLYIVHARLFKDLKKLDLAKAEIKRAKDVAPEELHPQIDEIASELFEEEDGPAIRPGSLKPSGDQ